MERHYDNSPHRECGEVQVIFGPMFSGKSTELIRRLRRHTAARRRCIVVKYAADARYASSDKCATHDRTFTDAIPARALSDPHVSRAVSQCDVIGVDEGQFFPDIVEIAEKWANSGKTVVVAALDADFRREAFGPILGLVPLAESVVKLSAVCHGCLGPAAFSRRIGDETDVEVIGGADKYVAACRKCYGLVDGALREERDRGDVGVDVDVGFKPIDVDQGDEARSTVGLAVGRAI